jgi:hypothetical protein
LSVALLLLPDFLLIACGALLKRVRGFDVAFWPGLERLVYFVLFPALLFRSLARAPLALGDTGRMVAVALAFTLAGILLSAALAQWGVLRRHSRRAGWWAATASLAWAIALLAASKLLLPDRGLAEALFSYLLDAPVSVEHPPGAGRMLASALLLGLLAAALSGAGLAAILRARPPADTRRRTWYDVREGPQSPVARSRVRPCGRSAGRHGPGKEGSYGTP